MEPLERSTLSLDRNTVTKKSLVPETVRGDTPPTNVAARTTAPRAAHQTFNPGEFGGNKDTQRRARLRYAARQREQAQLAAQQGMPLHGTQ